MNMFQKLALCALLPVTLSAQPSKNDYQKQGEKSALLLKDIGQLTIECKKDKRKEQEAVILFSKFLGNLLKTVTPIAYFLTQTPSQSSEHRTALHNLRTYSHGFANIWQTINIEKYLIAQKVDRKKIQQSRKAHQLILNVARDLSHARDSKHVIHILKHAQKRIARFSK